MFPAKASMSGEEGLDDIGSLQGFERWRSRVQQKTVSKKRSAKNVAKGIEMLPVLVYNMRGLGGVAHLGERLTGSQEVRGSIPLISTKSNTIY